MKLEIIHFVFSVASVGVSDAELSPVYSVDVIDPLHLWQTPFHLNQVLDWDKP